MFDERPDIIPVVRTAQGVNITIPAKVKLDWINQEEPQPTLTNLRANIYCKDGSGSELLVCHIQDEDYYEAASPLSLASANFIWMDALRGLLAVESTRQGGPANLDIDVRGEFAYVIHCAETQAPEDHRIYKNPPRYAIRTTPYVRLVERLGVSYSADVWGEMLHTALGIINDDPYLLSLPLHSFLQRRG